VLQESINLNKENIYAHLALGDALERQKEIEKAIMAYKDLMGLGVKIHGLKEKINYLENVLANMKVSNYSFSRKKKKRRRMLFQFLNHKFRRKTLLRKIQVQRSKVL